ncbi:hypothetical protein LX69_01683 [Breznakibacter xylanolyticus]|uniref:Uncharacterized protein n=1 Tax=Breznakibacter xylanolyticus TaxID=990 RepID=A0A2W7Q587_9BACT|nr:hypothetical protein LX69_01683 [Breznakibacter xylanolyticus]
MTCIERSYDINKKPTAQKRNRFGAVGFRYQGYTHDYYPLNHQSVAVILRVLLNLFIKSELRLVTTML